MKILVADDSNATRSVISAHLTELGHDVLIASNGQQALEIFKDSHPDLVILDVVMLEMDGFECARQMRALEKDDWIPIIFLSASVDDVHIAKGIDAGGDDYLSKPFSAITLAAKIRAMQRISDMRKKLYALTKKLNVLSITDSLTGLYNRLHFEQTLKEKLAEADRHGFQIALMFIDVDHFKTINDTLGHDAGDALLVDTAQVLKACVRINDFVSRIGGDEFAIILSNITDQDQVKTAAEKLTKNLAKEYKIGTHSIKVSVSIGISLYPSAGTTHENFVRNADKAMYKVKQAGRNNYQVFVEQA